MIFHSLVLFHRGDQETVIFLAVIAQIESTWSLCSLSKVLAMRIRVFLSLMLLESGVGQVTLFIARHLEHELRRTVHSDQQVVQLLFGYHVSLQLSNEDTLANLSQFLCVRQLFVDDLLRVAVKHDSQEATNREDDRDVHSDHTQAHRTRKHRANDLVVVDNDGQVFLIVLIFSACQKQASRVFGWNIEGPIEHVVLRLLKSEVNRGQLRDFVLDTWLHWLHFELSGHCCGTKSQNLREHVSNFDRRRGHSLLATTFRLVIRCGFSKHKINEGLEVGDRDGCDLNAASVLSSNWSFSDKVPSTCEQNRRALQR